MAIMLGNIKTKFRFGELKVKKMYKGTTQVYSSGSICTYHVDGATYQEEIDEGVSCLSPTSFTVPEKLGYTFMGWSLQSGGDVLTDLVMGDNTIELYAVWIAKSFYVIKNGSLVDGNYTSANRNYGGGGYAHANRNYGIYYHTQGNDEEEGQTAGPRIFFNTRECTKVTISGYVSFSNSQWAGSGHLYVGSTKIAQDIHTSFTYTANVPANTAMDVYLYIAPREQSNSWNEVAITSILLSN